VNALANLIKLSLSTSLDNPRKNYLILKIFLKFCEIHTSNFRVRTVYAGWWGLRKRGVQGEKNLRGRGTAG
ncbi:MAG: hypothetical protein LBL93_07760, partial [Ruminococcus sp.]|nr:hypothetical protein [Ruminococcus sp.]